MSEEQEQYSQTLIPLTQETIMFRGLPLVVVRLPDNRPGVVLRWICENLHIQPQAQTDRIKRTEAIADDLVYVQVQTEGGLQTMPTLVLHSVPYWLATIDTRRMEKDDPKRLEILYYQREVVDTLYTWAQSFKPATSTVVPAEPITKPIAPTEEASLEDWRAFYTRMIAWIDWQRDIEVWQGDIEARVESLEEVTSIILEQLKEPTLTPEHQNLVKYYVSQLNKASGKHPGTIYSGLYTAFSVPRYQDIPEAEWDRVVNWFKIQIERGQK